MSALLRLDGLEAGYGDPGDGWRVGENLGPLNSHVQSFFSQGQAAFLQRTGDPARSQQMTLQSLGDLRQQ